MVSRFVKPNCEKNTKKNGRNRIMGGSDGETIPAWILRFTNGTDDDAKTNPDPEKKRFRRCFTFSGNCDTVCLQRVAHQVRKTRKDSEPSGSGISGSQFVLRTLNDRFDVADRFGNVFFLFRSERKFALDDERSAEAAGQQFFQQFRKMRGSFA